MHFDFLIEDLSGKKMLTALLPKIIISSNTYTIKHYSGIGHLPKNLKRTPDPKTRGILNNLPKLIEGFGKTYQGYGENYKVTLIVVIDLDSRNKKDFLQVLNKILDSCTSQPSTYFCFMIEEGEAWFLGDINAIKQAYPKVKQTILKSYIPDSICDTWELLADAIYPGGREALKRKGTSYIGREKSNWAKNITPHIDVENNKSQSFQYFREVLLKEQD